MESKRARETQLDMGKVFESFDRGFGGAEIGISLRKCQFDFLGDPLGRCSAISSHFLSIYAAATRLCLSIFGAQIELQSCRDVEEEE